MCLLVFDLGLQRGSGVRHASVLYVRKCQVYYEQGYVHQQQYLYKRVVDSSANKAHKARLV